MRVGDCIRWRTRGNGKVGIRVGKVIAIIPPKCEAREVIDALARDSTIYDTKAIGSCTPRPYETYVVGVIGSRRVELFWPRIVSIIEVIREH